MKRIRLTREERAIEKALLRGEYKPIGREETRRIADALARRKKDAVLNIRVNSMDLADIKKKARRLGVPYQTFISEVLHQVAA
jgi:predicted DNA binding CopG/RHH family protein